MSEDVRLPLVRASAKSKEKIKAVLKTTLITVMSKNEKKFQILFVRIERLLLIIFSKYL